MSYIDFFPFLSIISKSILNASGTQKYFKIWPAYVIGDCLIWNVVKWHSLQMTSQWGHCKHNCIISLHEVLKCLERMKFNSCDTEYII